VKQKLASLTGVPFAFLSWVNAVARYPEFEGLKSVEKILKKWVMRRTPHRFEDLLLVAQIFREQAGLNGFLDIQSIKLVSIRKRTFSWIQKSCGAPHGAFKNEFSDGFRGLQEASEGDNWISHPARFVFIRGTLSSFGF
jgi:hypothetical protein